MYTEVFSVSGGNLVCTENTVAKQLVSGISGMDIVYGIDAASPASGSVTKYVDASALTTPAQWATVKTVRVTLLFANPLAGQSGQGATVSFSRTMAYLNGL
jgi:type IV pilus assembly protein PilW